MTFKPTFLAALTALVTGPAWAEITVEDAYFRTASPTSKTGAAFMILHNSGPEDDRLIAAKAGIAKRVELHTHIDVGDGVMQMREVEDGFAVPADSQYALKRGGDHVMLLGMLERVEEGTVIPITLVFEKAGEIVIDVPLDRDRAMEHGTKGHGDMKNGDGS